MNLICEAVTIQCNIVFDGLFPGTWSWDYHNQESMPFSIISKSKTPKFTFTAKYHINQLIILSGHRVTHVPLFCYNKFIKNSSLIIGVIYPKVGQEEDVKLTKITREVSMGECVIMGDLKMVICNGSH